ncbi:hypothetical protein [Xylanimonas oleitrophica]|uniref:hypothetical protein n=1 Tax=Xylanimonas oleitrophica TaxID=2607479 RepID=UPI0011B6B965|nr:hypothetical protein [Xylanimonas oleitrophica]
MHDAATANLAAAYDVTAWQAILNAHEIPPRRTQASGWIDVRARLVWERDGEEYLETAAFAWTSRLVLVGCTARKILLGDADQCIYTFRVRDGVRVERITDAAAAAGAENTLVLPDVSHRDPSGVIPGVARAIQRRDFYSDAITEAINQRRFEVRLGIPLADEVEAVSATVQALRADGLGVAVFTHHNDMLAALSDGLDEAGINHEIAGLSDALAAALDAQVAMLRFAFNEAEWRDVLQELAVFVTSSVRGTAIPPLAKDIMAGNGATTLQARLLDVWSELDEAPDVETALATAARAHAALGLPAKSSAWEHAAQLLGSIRARAVRRNTRLGDERALVAAIAASAREATVSALTDLAGEPHAVELMNLYQTKGREADATVVVLRDSDFMGSEREPYPNTSRLLYVVFSRARQRIVVLLVGDARRLPGAVAPLATIFSAAPQ